MLLGPYSFLGGRQEDIVFAEELCMSTTTRTARDGQGRPGRLYATVESSQNTKSNTSYT